MARASRTHALSKEDKSGFQMSKGRKKEWEWKMLPKAKRANKSFGYGPANKNRINAFFELKQDGNEEGDKDTRGVKRRCVECLVGVQEALEFVEVNVLGAAEVVPHVDCVVVLIVQRHFVDRDSLFGVPFLSLLRLEIIETLRSQEWAAQVVESAHGRGEMVLTIEKIVGSLNVGLVRFDRHSNGLGSLDLDGLGDDFLAGATKLLQGICRLLEITFLTLKRRAIGTAVVSQVGSSGRVVARERMTRVECRANITVWWLVEFGTGQIDFGGERGA